MRPRPLLAASLLLATLALLGARCATDSGGRANGRFPGGRMARRDRPSPQEVWQQYDLNGDGRITRGEFMAVRATCFARYDANGDGLLTRAEVKRRLPARLAERIDAEFSRLDLDGDGQISREEFDRENDHLFQQLDTNGDGVLAGTELGNMTPSVLGDLCAGGSGRLPGASRERSRVGGREESTP